MNSNAKIDRNLAKINALSTTFYEKEVIRSAYLNYLNNVAIAPHAAQILQKHSIVFRLGGDIYIRNKTEKIEQRKQHYRRRENAQQSTHVRENALKQSQKKSPSLTLIKLTQTAQSLHIDTQKLLVQCEELLDVSFDKQELSYSMIKNIIAKIQANLQASLQAFMNFLQPFYELFDGLKKEMQEDILTKSTLFLDKIQASKDTSADLCIKLSLIRAQNTLKKENDFISYLNHTIKQLDSYIQQ